MVLVTGANGLIGSFICRELLGKNYSIRALRRQDSDLSLLQDIVEEIEWVEGDILDLLSLEKAVAGVSWVIHSAAFISYDSKDEDAMYKINVEGTANVVNTCLAKGVPHLLHVSSVASLGKDKHIHRVDETSSTVNTEAMTSYARSKYLSELEVWRGTTEGLKAVVINPSLVLGPGNWNKSSTRVFKYIWDENRFYTGGIVNFVDVRDVAAAAVQLMEADVYGERFIISGGSTTYKELFDSIALAFGKRPPGIQLKGAFIRLAIVADKLRARLSGRKQMVTDELERVSRNRHIFDNTKVRSALQYSFRTLDETVDWCCQQLRQKSGKF